MKIQLLPRRIYFLLAIIVLMNLLFLGGTWLFHHHLYEVLNGNWGESSSLSFLLVEFSLAKENVLATWYSSMLFLAVGLMSLLCFLVRKKRWTTKREKYLNVGWLFFSLLFVGLSLDEMASLHERLGNMAALNPFGDYPLGWIFLLGIPIGIVVCLMAWFSLVQLKRAPLAVAFAVVGILLFMSVPLQEYIEVEAWNAAPDMATWERPVHFLLIEEGTELFAATFMLISTFIFLLYALNNENKLIIKPPPVLDLNLPRRKIIFLTGLTCGFLFLVLLLLINSSSLALEGDPGVMHNWFPSAVAFLGFLISSYLFYKDRHQRNTLAHPYLLGSILSLFISLYYGSNLYGYLQNPAGSLWKMIVISNLCFTIVSIGLMLIRRSKQSLTKSGIALWALLMVIALPLSNLYAAVLVFLAFSVLLLVLTVQYFEQRALQKKELTSTPTALHWSHTKTGSKIEGAGSASHIAKSKRN